MKSGLFFCASMVLTGISGASQFTYAQSAVAHVEKIRYCRTIWPICNDKLMSEYHWWEDKGVPDQIQKNTYISRYNEPAKTKVKNIVLIASGQRFSGIDHNLLTGQRETRAFNKDEAARDLEVSTSSLAYRLFHEDVFSTEDTFAALAFDARFNWGFSKDNKRDIVNAYFSWLTSKADMKKLQTVYLVGHSRGGALVMRLAKKFQEEYPELVVIVQPFDAVTNRKKGELGAVNASLNNPVAGYPRDSDLLDNKGNWAWKTNMRNYFPHMKNLAVYNFAIGGKVFGLAQDVRSVTEQSASNEITNLGWFYQRWFDMPTLGAAAKDAGGHNLIARSYTAVSSALSHVRERKNILLNNLAPLASVQSSSTYCTSSGMNCYSPARVNDRDFDTRVGGYYSWTNKNSGDSWLKLQWQGTLKTRYLEIYTSESYPISDFDIEYFDNGKWYKAYSERNNKALVVKVNLSSDIETNAIRLVGLSGPANQPQYHRINEIVVKGEWTQPPNKAPVAKCSASPSRGESGITPTFTTSGSHDSDGSITSYHWNFGDGKTGSGSSVMHTFINDRDIHKVFSVRLTVTDNDGAKGYANCSVIVTPRCVRGANSTNRIPPDCLNNVPTAEK